ncbi:acyl-CoA dehydrogenase C-terminal domain-containing protein [Aquisediminimonas sediminicola]|uniref:acyl-CoA dehydrogenase C-terminal domain-containing protein n=1 Tax=Alteraquisediminimonas sediminicola TaxID=2676787 RepID=UPI001C8ECA0C|nr:acyl-CoA dehydrogenase C-terminal domain-containing protein [Aquisediminimonas sediminicola]
MPQYTPPLRDTRFVLDHVVGLSNYADLPGFAQATPDLVAAVLEGGGQIAAEILFPLNQIGDKQGCTRHEDGRVTTPDGFKTAYDQYVAGGWTTLECPEIYGGQGLPKVIATAFGEYVLSANQAFEMYPGLTGGAIAAILVKGSEAQKSTYLPSMVAGKWSGTMNLTEPHCGTDLGLIRTKAVPQPDGSYRITGTKIFISAGEHDLTENIIHLVLAKTPDAPDNVKGISLFIVPKFLVNPDGSLGARNEVSCGAIEHKMGINGSATCVMNYDGATGYLIGEENKGLAAMFIMMNSARLSVGLQGLGQAEIAYQNAVHYAKDRRQGRALTGPKDPMEKADPLIVHPDVRRMLMEAKALTEGLRALCLWGALQVDLVEKAANEEARVAADDIISLLTPVIKGYGTDKGFEVAVNCQQIWGGHGYIRENGMDQYVRDARIAQIYEGANGVQAMDLVGRKLAMNGGRAIRAFFALVDHEASAAKAEANGQAAITDLATRLEKANGELKAATMWLMQNAMGNPDNAGAGAMAYLHLMGIVAVGLMWLRMARAAAGLLAKGEGDRAYLEAKLITAQFFGERFMPDAGALRRKLEAGAGTMMAMPADSF